MNPSPADPGAVLADRIRPALPPADVREVRMFGARCFMVDGAMAVAANADGSLLVRVDRARDTELLDRAGVSRPEMGRGRSMGSGWLRVAADTLRDDAVLAEWIAVALSRPR